MIEIILCGLFVLACILAVGWIGAMIGSAVACEKKHCFVCGKDWAGDAQGERRK